MPINALKSAAFAAASPDGVPAFFTASKIPLDNSQPSKRSARQINRFSKGHEINIVRARGPACPRQCSLPARRILADSYDTTRHRVRRGASTKTIEFRLRKARDQNRLETVAG